MTKCFNILFSLIATALLLVSCGDLLEHSQNGKLDGYWKLTTIDTLTTGGQKDVSEQSLFMAVQGKIMMLNNRDNGAEFIFQFNNSNGHLKIFDARQSNRTTSDPLLTDPEAIRPFGFNNLEEDFTVEKLTSGKLVLNDGTLRLHFIKF
ncbi:lipocalin-like domain-containing protein [Hallella mizrahii]|uniref:Lipocalin family protein n=1 Tax=Hallella mizrahii TaxID=2606637 RepID=A0A7K0KEE0_9BACT|nr:lipocalin-like domain-containing protein [Hallella mizrahii]MST83800.1 lipocalin family protein [Hallella mizrahii]